MTNISSVVQQSKTVPSTDRIKYCFSVGGITFIVYKSGYIGYMSL